MDPLAKFSFLSELAILTLPCLSSIANGFLESSELQPRRYYKEVPGGWKEDCFFMKANAVTVARSLYHGR